jgi:hypothetical protein
MSSEPSHQITGFLQIAATQAVSIYIYKSIWPERAEPEPYGFNRPYTFIYIYRRRNIQP